MGFTLGFMAGRKFAKATVLHWERTTLFIVITLIWGLSAGVSIFNSSYETPTAIHGLLGLVAGYFFQGSVVEAFKSWKENNSSKTPTV